MSDFIFESFAAGAQLCMRMFFNGTGLTPHQSPAVTASPAVIVIRSLRLRDNLAWVLLTKSKIWTTPHQGEAFALRVTWLPLIRLLRRHLPLWEG